MRQQTFRSVVGWASLICLGTSFLLFKALPPLPSHGAPLNPQGFFLLLGVGLGVLYVAGAIWRGMFAPTERPAPAAPRYAHHPHQTCWLCNEQSAVVSCAYHRVPLCVRCMFRHDLPGTCSYVPDSDKRKAALATATA